MNFLIFRDCFKKFLNFSQFKIDLLDFIFTQVMWQNVEHPITRLITTVDRHLRRGERDAILFIGESF